MPTEIDPVLLSDYIDNFFGYGNYRGRLWFIGMEEGGGATLDEIQRRLSIWGKRGRYELEDIAAYHLELNEDRLFIDPVKSQPTWNKLIRMVLARPADLAEVKAYQRDRLGRWDADTCLLELLPLPSRSTGHWQYEALTSIPHLLTRNEYREYYATKRVEHIRQRIAEYRPAGVVFYSVDKWYRQWWEKIAGSSFTQNQYENRPYFTTSDSHTYFIIAKHPTSFGVTIDYFHHIGQLLQYLK